MPYSKLLVLLLVSDGRKSDFSACTSSVRRLEGLGKEEGMARKMGGYILMAAVTVVTSLMAKSSRKGECR